MENTEKKNSLRDYFDFSEVFGYFFRSKAEAPEKKSNLNLRMMHTINKIAIVVFLVGMIYFAIRMFLRN